MSTKICSRCKKELPITFFVKNKARPDGLGPYCRGCHNAKNREWAVKNKEKVSAKNKRLYRTPEGNKAKFNDHLRQNYGILAPMLYDMFYVAYSGCCSLCGKPESELNTRLCFEHNHTTGEIRGIVCRGCNSVIAWAETNSLKKLEGYLNEI